VSPFLLNPSWYGYATSANEPAHTIVASQHKAPVSVVVPFLIQSFGGPVASKSTSANEPSRTVLASPNQQLVQPFMLHNYGGANRGRSLSEPCATITCEGGQQYLIQPKPWLMKYLSNPPSGKPNPGQSLDQPGPTATTQDRIALVQPLLMGQQSGSFPRPVDQPAPTVATGAAQQLITPQAFLDQQYGASKPTSLEQPAGTVTVTPKLNLVQPQPFIDKQYGTGVAASIEQPMGTVTTSGNHHALVQPMQLQVEQEPICWTEKEGDSVTMRMIRIFCKHWNLADVRMRMLFVNELSRIQGFPEGYQLTGGQTNAKKQLGNAVEVTVATAIGHSLMATQLQYA
jgi:DNA (cytosine-5)-methyltransferase 1